MSTNPCWFTKDVNRSALAIAPTLVVVKYTDGRLILKTEYLCLMYFSSQDATSGAGWASTRHQLPPVWVDKVDAVEEDVRLIQLKRKKHAASACLFIAFLIHMCLLRRAVAQNSFDFCEAGLLSSLLWYCLGCIGIRPYDICSNPLAAPSHAPAPPLRLTSLLPLARNRSRSTFAVFSLPPCMHVCPASCHSARAVGSSHKAADGDVR